jgi:hypothetical protein
MGVDICGKKPTGKQGKYFANNWVWWHPLVDYCFIVAPTICEPCGHWRVNYGDGLDAAGAVALAEALQKEVDAGRTEAYAQQYASEQGPMPDEPCLFCRQTGVQQAMPHPGLNLQFRLIKCTWCQGAGYIQPSPPFSTENVTEFIAFLRESGGFKIW